MLLSFVIALLGTIKYNEGRYIGDKCSIQSKSGVCKLISQCQPVLQEISKGVKPILCGFDGQTPIVCCPTLIQSSGGPSKIGTKSQQRCDEYKKKLRRPQLGIINGLPASAGEFPHMVALGYGGDDGIEWLCGGTLVSEKFVLTAGHCVHSQHLGTVKTALLGTTNLKEHYKGGYPQIFSIVKTYQHPDFKPPSTYNDIALLELNGTVEITPYVVPACINTDLNLTVGQAIGWGRQEFAGETSNNLMKVDLLIYDHNRCNKSYSNVAKRLLQTGILKDSQICAGGGLDESKDTCQGDSGGPFHIPTDRIKIFTVIGVTSFGKGCGNANIPGVYTRVSHFLPWIESIVWR